MANYLPIHNVDARYPTDAAEPSDTDIVNVLESYRTEAEMARMSGPNPRDEVWRVNWDRYWGRYSVQGKANWQSKHVMPESVQMVDRWSAAMREALDAGGEWFTASDESGVLKDFIPEINKVMRVLLSRISRTPDGHPMDFSSVFEDQMKLGSLMACCASVTWQKDREAPDGWPRVESVDPREVWYDPKNRNLYRRRRYEIDKWELMGLAEEVDELGDNLYNVDAIADLVSEESEKTRENLERSTGSGRGDPSAQNRTTVKLDEWYCTVCMPDGKIAYTDSLIVVANERHIIRGPEVNPFWHDRDWLVFCPMISVPLSIYGRTYMESWGDVADAFVELTNVILDGATTAALRAFVANPDLLEDPTSLAEGISPNKVLTTDEDVSDVRRFINSIELGNLPQEAVVVWKALKEEMREGAMLNEIALGQMAPNARTTAFEINSVKQAGSAMVRSMARTIEARFVEPLLNMIWKTALQHMDFTVMSDTIGPNVAAALNARRQEFHDRAIGFRVRGISGIVDRQQRLQNLLNALSVINQNQNLTAALLQQMSPQKLLRTLVQLFGIDVQDLQLTREEAIIDGIAQSAAGAAAAALQGAASGPAGQPGAGLI